MLAEKSMGSCGIIEMCLLRKFSPNVLVSTLSIVILPSVGANLKSADIRDDFPAPVLPTIPTCKSYR